MKHVPHAFHMNRKTGNRFKAKNLKKYNNTYKKAVNRLVYGLKMVREAGLEPARPEWTLEPESSESANSTTRACFVLR